MNARTSVKHRGGNIMLWVCFTGKLLVQFGKQPDEGELFRNTLHAKSQDIIQKVIWKKLLVEINSNPKYPVTMRLKDGKVKTLA